MPGFSSTGFGASFDGGTNDASSVGFDSSGFGGAFSGGTNDAASSSAFSSGAFGAGFNGGTNDSSTVSSGKVIFDGPTRTITVAAGIGELDVRNDIYSAWKEWMLLDDNTKYLPAFRVSGGDPISSTQFTGDIYFLTNNWQIEVDHSIDVTGVIYSDNYPNPFRNAPGTTIVRNKVSSLVQSVILTPSQLYTGPSVSAIATAVRTELANELSHVMQVSTSNPGLTQAQATMLLEMYTLLGLDPTKPLLVTSITRTAGDIQQTILATADQTLVTRV